MKESDMFEDVKALMLSKMGCKEVFAEVGVVDVVGLKGEYSIVVEMKKQLNFKVIEQAIRSLRFCDYTFIAVPKPKQKHSRLAIDLLKQHGIGLMYIKPGSDSLDPAKNRSSIVFWGKRQKKKSRDIRKSINRDFHVRTIGGVKSGDGITEYAEMIEEIKTFLRRKNNWASIDEILEGVLKARTHYKQPKSSIAATLRKSWNANWCERKVENRKTFFKFKEQVTE